MSPVSLSGGRSARAPIVALRHGLWTLAIRRPLQLADHGRGNARSHLGDNSLSGTMPTEYGSLTSLDQLYVPRATRVLACGVWLC